MRWLNAEWLAAHLAEDPIARLLEREERPGDEASASHRWLRDSGPKRLMCHEVYGDLLAGGPRKRVLDVGGGVSALTRLLRRGHDYRLVEVFAHDRPALGPGEEPFWIEGDWFEKPLLGPYDLVIANDLFPNVDQRLVAFLEKALPLAKEVRVSLTYYPSTRYYMTRRIGAEEVLVMLAWDGEQTSRALRRFEDRVIEPRFERFGREPASVFPNGRQVCLVHLRGDRA